MEVALSDFVRCGQFINLLGLLRVNEELNEGSSVNMVAMSERSTYDGRHHHRWFLPVSKTSGYGKVTYVGGKVIWMVLLAGRTKVFSVTLKEASSLAPARTWARVGTLGGK